MHAHPTKNPSVVDEGCSRVSCSVCVVVYGWTNGGLWCSLVDQWCPVVAQWYSLVSCAGPIVPCGDQWCSNGVPMVVNGEFYGEQQDTICSPLDTIGPQMVTLEYHWTPLNEAMGTTGHHKVPVLTPLAQHSVTTENPSYYIPGGVSKVQFQLEL
jgi:hypothetical protein